MKLNNFNRMSFYSNNLKAEIYAEFKVLMKFKKLTIIVSLVLTHLKCTEAVAELNDVDEAVEVVRGEDEAVSLLD